MALIDSHSIQKMFTKKARRSSIFKFNAVVIALMILVVFSDSILGSGIITSPTLLAVMGAVISAVNAFLKLTQVEVPLEVEDKPNIAKEDEKL